MRVSHSVVGALIGVCLNACATQSTQGVFTKWDTTSRTLQEAEIRTVSATSAHEVIRRLRPGYLTARRGAEATVVYVDGARLGGLMHLELVAAVDLSEVRFLTPIEATHAFGAGHSGGAIVIRTQRR